MVLRPAWSDWAATIRCSRASAVEAEEAARIDPALASFLMTAILNHDTLEGAVIHRVAERLDHGDAPSSLIRQAYEDVVSRDSSIGEAFPRRHHRGADRDPACLRLMEPLLYFKGFHALQAYRLAHALLRAGGAISRFICKAASRRRSASTSIRPRASARESFSITRRVWWSARRR